MTCMFISSCSKEETLENTLISNDLEMSLEKSRSIWQDFSNSNNEVNSFVKSSSTCNNLSPIWSMARSGHSASGVELIVVPVYQNLLSSMELREGAELVFFGGTNCDYPIELVTYKSNQPNIKKNNLCEFTGKISIFSYCDCSQYGLEIEEGSITYIYDNPVRDYTGCDSSINISTRGDKIECPNPAGSSESWWDRLWGWLTAPGGSGGSSGGVRINTFMSGTGGWNGFRFGFPNYGWNPGGETPTGGGVPMGDLFSFNILSGEGVVALNELNRLIAENDLVMCTEQLHNLLYQCMTSGNPDPGSCGILVEGGDNTDPNSQEEFEIDIYNYVDALLEMDGTHDCMTNIVSMFSDPNIDMKGNDGLLMCYIDDNNDFTILDEKLLDLIKEKCNGDEECEVNIFECLGKLSQYEDAFEYEFTTEQIDNYVFRGDYSICDKEGEEFLDYVDCKIMRDDYITEDSTLNECPLLDCIYNALSSQQTNNFVCQYLTPSFDDENFEVIISVGQVSGGGESSYDTTSQQANLILSEDNCISNNPDEVYIAAQILHEFVHIELFRQMVDAGLNPNSFEDYYSFWNSWTDWIYEVALEQGADEVHHHVMIKYQEIMRPLAESLFILFDGESNGLTVDHFMMSAANGLFYAMELHGSNDPNFNTLYSDFTNQYSSLSSELNNLNLSLGCD